MATLAGKRHGARQGLRDDRGLVIEDVYIVRGALSVADALMCPGLPAYGSPAPEDPSIIVRRYDPVELRESGSFDIRVTWMPPGGALSSETSTQRVNWNHGLSQQFVTVDLDGKRIGNRYYVRLDGFGLYKSTPFLHDDAKLGTDVQVATMQAEILMPNPSTYNPVLVNSLIGRTNHASLLIDGFEFAAGTVILIGSRAVRTRPRPANDFEVSYLVAMGESELPSNLLRYMAADEDQYESSRIPLEYGYSVEYSPYDRSGALARTETDIFESRPARVLVHRLYRRANIGQLGWT